MNRQASLRRQFFLELWEQLEAGSQNGPQSGVGAGVNYDEVKDRTSSSMGDGEEAGALFDETIAAYSLRHNTAQDLLVSALNESHAKAFRGYKSRAQFSTIGDSSVLGRFPRLP